MKEIKKSDYILIGVLSLLVVLLIIMFNIKNSNNNIKEESDIKVVNNLSTFFTVEATANKYIKELYNQNIDNLLILLDDNYIKDNVIDKNNVLNKLDKLEGTYNYKLKKIYEQDYGDYTKYYLYGLLQKDIINEYDYGTDYYLIN